MRRKSRAEIEAAKRFRRLVLAKGYCIGTVIDLGHECDGDMHAHHVIRKQTLRLRFALDLDAGDLWEIVYDPDDGVPACDRIHTPLTSKVGRNAHIPFDLVPHETVAFAERLRITHLLEKECPRDPLF